MSNNITWPQERVDRLLSLFGEGLSCSMMALELGDGMTRNAIIGKLSRMGLSNPKPAKTLRPPVKAQAPKPQPRIRIRLPEKVPDVRMVEKSSRKLTLSDLEADDCRWPFGDKEFTFCGHRQLEGSSYCAAHFRLSFRLNYREAA